jgi:hypothetical protein
MEDWLMERPENGVWSEVLGLAPGEYQYKFVVDDAWMDHKNNPKGLSGPYHGTNSVMSLNQKEFL